MKTLRIAGGLTAALLALSVAAPAAAQAPPRPTGAPSLAPKNGVRVPEPSPEIRAFSWMVADLDTGEVLAGRNWHDAQLPASTLKVLAAVALTPELALDSPYVASKDDVSVNCKPCALVPGAKYTVRDLLHGALMPSWNDAAHALGAAFGDHQLAVDKMNEEAKRLGATSTVAKNTSGLDADGQTSSAYDLTLFLREALKNPELAQILATHDTVFPKADKKDPSKVQPDTIWTKDRPILNRFPGALGGKDGFTSDAGNTYVGAANIDGHRIGVAIVRGYGGRMEAAIYRLWRWAGQYYNDLQPIDHLADPAPMDKTPVKRPASFEGADNRNNGAVAGDTGPMVFLLFLMLLGLGVGVCMFLWFRSNRKKHDPPVGHSGHIDIRERDSSVIR